jgi:primase-like protein/bifunctional DNA primase/polymerase-like protein
MILPVLNPALIPIPAGQKRPICKRWQGIRLTPEEAEKHVAGGGNLAMRDGPASGNVVDVDLDCREAIELAPIYLPLTGAIFGRPSKPRSHWLYNAPGALFATFADPLISETLLELRAEGREGGAHLTLLPPSVTDGEQRRWEIPTPIAAEIHAAVLTERIRWLATGCLVMRHISEHAARNPRPDLPALLWEADRHLGRAAFQWLGRPIPDQPQRHPKPRNRMSNDELRLAEVVAGIKNDFDWHGWNRIGMAIYAASGGSEEGFIAFDDLSARSPKYCPHATRERWNNYRRSPPSRIGIGSIVHAARECGWHPERR